MEKNLDLLQFESYNQPIFLVWKERFPMNKANTPFRYDYVGSFLRPAGLKQARADFQNGKIGADELKAAEDPALCCLATSSRIA